MSTRWIYFFSILLMMSGFVFLQASEKQKIKVIVFDFGSVIAKTNSQEVLQFIAQSLQIPESEASLALKYLKENADKDQAQDQEEELWMTYAKSKGILLPPNWQAKLNEAKLQATQEIPGMVALVKELQRQGYQTALLSNIRKSQADLKQKLGYYKLFNPALFSYEIGVKKPERKAYEILLSKLNVSPQSIIFIDNRAINVEAAKTLGMDGIVFVNRDQLVQELKKRGIELSFAKENSL